MTKELKQLLIIGGVIVAVVAVLIVVSQYKSANKPVATEALLRSDSHAAGPEDAPVTLVEFGDFQCPACASAEPMVKQLRTEFADNLRFVFRNFPLVSLHPNATRAAEAAEAAAEQGKFWEMHDLLYEQQTVWAGMSNPSEQFKAYAKQLGLDESKFAQDSSDAEVTGRVSRDFSDGGVLGVNATPTFYINGQKVENATYDAMKQQIEDIIARSKTDQSQEATPSATPAP